MKTVPYMLKLQGLKSGKGNISLRTLGAISNTLLDACERALRFAVEGVSVKRGKAPAWLEKSIDINVGGIHPGSTIIDLDAPILEETAFPQIERQSFLDVQPKGEDTALTVLAKAVSDALSNDVEGNFFDRGVLDALLNFKSLLGSNVRMEIDCQERPLEHIGVAKTEFEKISTLEARIPQPQVTIVAGRCNLIERSHGRFELLLEDGRKIQGALDPTLIHAEKMRELWAKKVTLKGIAHFTPSGRIRYIEAQAIKDFEPTEKLFEAMPGHQTSFEFLSEFRRKHPSNELPKEIWGKWPGDESIEELLDLLSKQEK